MVAREPSQGSATRHEPTYPSAPAVPDSESLVSTAKRHRKTKAHAKHRKGGGGFGIHIGAYNPQFNHPETLLPGYTAGPKVNDIAGGAAGAAGQAAATGVKNVIIDPVIGDFKKNRGKIVIGLVAGIILLGAGFKSINSLTGGAVSGVATAAVAPEVEGLSVIRQGAKAGARARLSSAKTRLHAREPIRPVRYGMRKANP